MTPEIVILGPMYPPTQARLEAEFTAPPVGDADQSAFLRSVADGVRGVAAYAQSPYIGSATDETRRAMGDLTVDNLLAHFAGRPLLTPVL